MLVELTSIPVGVLPLAAFREHLQLGTGFADDTLQDAVLETTLRAAIASIEARTGKVILTRSFGWTLSAWRHDDRQPLPLAPVTDVSSIVEIDADSVEVALPATWYLEPDEQRPMLRAKSGCLPHIFPNMHVRIEMNAGYAADWAGVPSDLKQAVFLLAAHYYANRSETAQAATEIPHGVLTLIEKYRTVRTFLGGRS